MVTTSRICIFVNIWDAREIIKLLVLTFKLLIYSFPPKWFNSLPIYSFSAPLNIIIHSSRDIQRNSSLISRRRDSLFFFWSHTRGVKNSAIDKKIFWAFIWSRVEVVNNVNRIFQSYSFHYFIDKPVLSSFSFHGINNNINLFNSLPCESVAWVYLCVIITMTRVGPSFKPKGIKQPPLPSDKVNSSIAPTSFPGLCNPFSSFSGKVIFSGFCLFGCLSVSLVTHRVILFSSIVVFVTKYFQY